AQRTQEIGIRISLGATRWSVVRMIMTQAAIPIIIGIAAGLIAASTLTRLLESYLFEVTPMDKTVFIAVAVFLALVAAAANLIPARRSARIDPMTALKYE